MPLEGAGIFSPMWGNEGCAAPELENFRARY